MQPDFSKSQMELVAAAYPKELSSARTNSGWVLEVWSMLLVFMTVRANFCPR